MNLRFRLGTAAVLALVAIVSTSPAVLLAQSDAALRQETPRTGFLKRVYRDKTGEHKYVVFVPSGYTPNRKWPVILFLHGAGERGNDGIRQTAVGIGPYVNARSKSFPFIVVFPQAEDLDARLLTGWLADSPDSRRALRILDTVEKDYNVDKNRRILTGWSMGGYGTWSLAAATPDRWSAVVPISGGGDTAWAKALKPLPVWAFHGASDGAVRPDESQRMIEAIKSAGGKASFSNVAGAGHEVWKNVYGTDALYTWMLNPQQQPAASDRQMGRATDGAAPLEEPFVPALHIPKALYLRLGNDALSAIAYSVPQAVPRDLLVGSINDIYDGTSVQGYYFNIRFSGITYSAAVSRANVTAYAKDALSIQLALSNVQLQIGQTYVSGSGRSAVAGPISIVVGSRRPVWLSLVVTPYVSEQRLRLQLRDARFDIPSDNWYVSSPAWVSTRGLGMTEDRVSSGLVDGLYGSKGRLEQEALAVVPPLLARLENQLALTEVTNLVSSFWPLPVYRPRVRVWPEQVQTDPRGVSFVLGVTAAAIDSRKAPKQPRVVPFTATDVAKVPSDTKLEVGLAGNILSPLSEMLISENAARIDVLDIPAKEFGALADRKALSEVIPELQRLPGDVRIRSELRLGEPLSIVDASTPAPKEPQSPPLSAADATKAADAKPATSSPNAEPEVRKFRFDIPKLVIAISIEKDPTTRDWTPFAEFDLAVSQSAVASIVPHGGQPPDIRIAWSGDPEIRATGRFDAAYKAENQTLDVNKFRDLFAKGWQAWTRNGPVSEVAVPDVDFGYTKFRLSDVGWAAPHFGARFSEPETTIVNKSDVPLEYETKGPYTGWSSPLVLQPGKHHAFRIPYPLLYRRKIDSQYQMYTLPVGSQSEFRPPRAGGKPSLFLSRGQ